MSDNALNSLYGDMILNEAHYGLRKEFPELASGQKGAVEAGRKLSYKNNKIGLPVSNMGDASAAGDVPFGNPYEQEEGESVDKAAVFAMIDEINGELDISNSTDRVAIMALGELKNKIKKL